MWGSNPLRPTSDGDCVIKNLALIGAALILIAKYSPRSDEPTTA